MKFDELWSWGEYAFKKDAYGGERVDGWFHHKQDGKAFS